MSAKRPNRRAKWPIVMGIIWGILIAITVVLIVNISSSEEKHYRSLDSCASDLASGNYGLLCYDLMVREGNGMSVENSPEYVELMAINHYFAAAGQYRMYKENNQPERAAFYAEKMQKALDEMGRFSYLKENLDAFVISME